jgi:hypothetical protein
MEIKKEENNKEEIKHEVKCLNLRKQAQMCDY